MVQDQQVTSFGKCRYTMGTLDPLVGFSFINFRAEVCFSSVNLTLESNNTILKEKSLEYRRKRWTVKIVVVLLILHLCQSWT